MLSFLILGCTEEIKNENLDQGDNSPVSDNYSHNGLDFKNVNFSDLNDDNMFKSLKKEFNLNPKIKTNNSTANSNFDNENSFIIDTNYVKVVSRPNYISYTFKIERYANKVGFIENLMVENKNGVESAYIMSYIPNEYWLVDFLNGHKMPFEGDVRIEKLSTDIKIGGEPVTNSVGCSTTTIITETSCSCAGHWPGQNCTCSQQPTTQLTQFEVCEGNPTEGPIGGGGHGGAGGGGVSPGGDESLTPITGADGHEVNVISILTNILQLNSEQSDWLTFNSDFADLVYTFIVSEFHSSEAISFSKEAVLASKNGADADFEYQVIVAKSFKENECLMDVYEAMGEAPTFDGYLQAFDSDASVANLKFSGSNTLSDTINAQTNPPISNNQIEIEFNLNNLDRPSLDVARTLIHEMIHATMFRWLLESAETGALSPENGMTQTQLINYIDNLKNDFPGLYDYYYDRRLPDWSHEQMAAHFIGIIKNALQEYDAFQTEETYEALAWAGLKNTISWNNLLQSERDNYDQVRQDFISNNSNCQ